MRMTEERIAFLEKLPMRVPLIIELEEEIRASWHEITELLEKNRDYTRRLLEWENLEASLCPEDVGFKELIADLRTKLTEARKAMEVKNTCLVHCSGVAEDKLKKALQAGSSLISEEGRDK